MRWDDFRRSDNVEDRRGLGPSAATVRRGGLGIGTIIILGLIAWGLGIDPRVLIGGAELVTSKQSYQAPSDTGEKRGQDPGEPG